MAQTAQAEGTPGEDSQPPSWLADYARAYERARARVELLKLDPACRLIAEDLLGRLHKPAGYRAANLLDLGDALERLRLRDEAVWRALQRDLNLLAMKHGVPPDQVLLVLLVRDYALGDQPELGAAPAILWGPSARLHVAAPFPDQFGEIVIRAIEAGMPAVLDTDPAASWGSFAVKITVPIDCPPDLMIEATRAARRAARGLLRAVRVAPKQLRLAAQGQRPIVVTMVTSGAGRRFADAAAEGCAQHDLPHRRDPSEAVAQGAPKVSPYAAARLEVTCPVTAPVADLRGGIRDAVRRSRNVLEHAGLRLGQRLATAPTLHEAAALRVGKRMGRLALGDLIDDLRGSGDEVPQVTKRERDLMKSRRSQAKRHALRRGYTPRA